MTNTRSSGRRVPSTRTATQRFAAFAGFSDFAGTAAGAAAPASEATAATATREAAARLTPPDHRRFRGTPDAGAPAAREGPPMLRALLLALLAALLVAPAADAAFSGSNGKVAWIDYQSKQLLVDDPYDEAGPVSYGGTTLGGSEHPNQPKSTPQFSPDGTKIAFTATIPDVVPFPDRSAVFVVDLKTKQRTQLSFPFEGKEDTCSSQCDNGEMFWDLSPVWTPEGKVAFIRWAATGDEAPHASLQGTNVYVVDPAAPGGETLIAHEDPNGVGLYQSIVWPDRADEPVAIFISAGGQFQLRKVLSDETLKVALGIVDLDASPDGKRLTFIEQTLSGGNQVATIDLADGDQVDRFNLGIERPNRVRFTPDGNGLMLTGCTKDDDDQQHCGFITHRLPDPNGDIHPDDPVEAPYLDGNPGQVGYADQPGNRSMFDVQSQDLPVIYAAGFLGSEISCGGENVWMPATPPIDLTPISLTPDGKGNLNCPGAGPTGEVVKKFLGADVYEHANVWLQHMNPPGGWATLGWDWRKAPSATIESLDGLIDEMLKKDLLVRQGTSRVALAGHSYGGLLIRTYLEDPAHAKKVARVLGVGNPWWGSPKSIFGVSFGVEVPFFSALDLFFENQKLKSFMANISGAYHLFPSDSYGPWLHVDGVAQSQAGVANWVDSVDGNPALLNEALQHHRDEIDGFFDNDGRIDVRSVVGLGLPTVKEVYLVPNQETGKVKVGVKYANGDGTVPGISASQGPIGTTDPLGDDIHAQGRCGIPHMDQTKDKWLHGAYEEFLLTGRTPRKFALAANCEPNGKEIEVFGDFEVPKPLPVTARRATAGPLTLGQAEFENRADVMRLPGGTLAVTNDLDPVSLRFEADGLSFAVTDIDGGDRGRRLVYGPVTGNVVVDPGAGETPTVTVDGAPVEPKEDSGDGGGNGGGGGGDTGGGDTGGGGHDVPRPPAPDEGTTPRPPAGDDLPPVAKLARRLTLKPNRRGVVTVRFTATPGTTGTLVLRDRRGKLGSARVTTGANGTGVARIRLAKRARNRRKLTATAALTLRDPKGRTARATAAVVVRR